jgi:formate hydrogenlyase transcriptional activator
MTGPPRPRPIVPAPADPAGPWQDELAFHSVVAASAEAGAADALREIVRQLAVAIGVAYAFVAEFAGTPARVRTVALWGRGAFMPDLEYDLAGTPCEEVAEGGICLHRDGVQERFPLDVGLVTWGARGYIGVPLVAADGRILGHLAVIDDKPIDEGPTMTLVRLFADRARVELERLRAQVVLERASQALEVRLERAEGELRLAREQVTALFRIQRAVAGHLDRRTLFQAVAEALRVVLPARRVILFVPCDDPTALNVYAAYGDTGVEFFEGEAIPRDGTLAGFVATHGVAMVVDRTDDVRDRFPFSYQRLVNEGMQGIAVLPLIATGRCLGALTMMSEAAGAWDPVPRALLDEMATSVAVALDNCMAHEELARLRDRLAAENVYLQEEIREEHDFREIVGRSPGMLAMLSRIETVAPTDATVLVLGETGTGKELVARAIHDRSQRSARPLVKLNCAALSAGLVESELFGHVKGAFTGALADRVGRFELADGGTIFLDEIGELAPETQAKLLRVMQEREFEPVGSSKTRRVDTRVIAATNRDLESAVADGKFRADLFYRLNVIPIRVPPLRERPGDVRLLVHQCVARYGRDMGKRIDGVSRETMARLEAYDWPGNVRELQNVIERAVVLATGPILEIEPEQLPAGSHTPAAAAAPAPAPRAEGGQTLEALQRRHIEHALAECGWVIEGARGAAALLGLNPNTLRSRMKKLGIRRPG